VGVADAGGADAALALATGDELGRWLARSLGEGFGDAVSTALGVATSFAFFATPGIGVGTAVGAALSVSSAKGDDVASATVSPDP